MDPDGRALAGRRAGDRLLASPHYGERWGRRWLDVARFVEDDTRGLAQDGSGRERYPPTGAPLSAPHFEPRAKRRLRGIMYEPHCHAIRPQS